MLLMRRSALALAVAVTALAFAAPARAQVMLTVQVSPNWALTPDGLADGDKFRLFFVTSTFSSPVSPNIDHYNDIVAARAAANPYVVEPMSYRAYASTGAVDAVDNTNTPLTVTDIPVYWLGGELMANRYSDLHLGDWIPRAARFDNGDRVDCNIPTPFGFGPIRFDV